MLIHYKADKNIFAAESKFEEKDIVKAALFQWQPVDRYWYTSDAVNAAKLLDYCTPEAKIQVELQLKQKQENIEMSIATNSNIDIPAPSGLAYLPFQKAGINFCLDKDNVLMADEPGLGKTIMSVGLINVKMDIKTVLVICPASLRLNWKRELDKWLINKKEVRVADTGFPDSPIVVVNYDSLKKHYDAVRSREWDLLIIDECHYLKNGKTLRSKQVFGGKLKKKDEEKLTPILARKRLFLTGTPIVNKPAELWNLLSHLDKTTWNNWGFYMKHYCNATYNGFGWDVGGASNLDEMHLKLRSSLMLRRLKKDVLKELPAKRRQVIVIPADDVKDIIRNEKKLKKEMKDRILQLKLDMEIAKTSNNEEDYVKAVKAMKQSRTWRFTEMARIRHETAVAKVPFVAEHVREMMEETDKVIIFAHHHDVIDGLIESLKDFGVVSLTGEDGQKKRQASIDGFQTNKDIRIFIGSIQASGVGITLTAASNVVFSELDWVPGNVTQAEDRSHRIGQEGSVLIQHIVLEDSIDEKIANTIVKKQEIIDRALDKDMQTIEQATLFDIDAVKKTDVSTVEDAEEEIDIFLDGEN